MVRLTEAIVYLRTKCTVEAVKKLNLWGCDIDDIEICSRMSSIEVLSLSVNRVQGLEPLRNCTKLRELYLRKNEIESLGELEHLKDIASLRVLWIDENPCTAVGEYRFKVVKLLPQLTKLDDKAVTQDDQLESEDSLPEIDMQASFYSTRSSRSSAHTIHNNDMMTRSLYVGRGAIVDTVMQPQIASFVDASDEEPVIPFRSFATVPEDDWGDFSLEEDVRPCSMDGISSRMCMSMYEERPRAVFPRSASAPRRRVSHRQPSTSPHRQNRLSKILSAVSVLMDELDPDGLREVIDDAQRRIKKQR